MAFVYQRTIHFPDTDAAGVVFFPNYLAICHEAYEEALAAAGINVRAFFSKIPSSFRFRKAPPNICVHFFVAIASKSPSRLRA